MHAYLTYICCPYSLHPLGRQCMHISPISAALILCMHWAGNACISHLSQLPLFAACTGQAMHAYLTYLCCPYSLHALSMQCMHTSHISAALILCMHCACNVQYTVHSSHTIHSLAQPTFSKKLCKMRWKQTKNSFCSWVVGFTLGKAFFYYDPHHPILKKHI